MKTNLFQSSVFKFCFIVLTVAGIVAFNKAGITWGEWLKSAIYCIGIYAGKEGVKYGSSAYKDRGNE